MPTLRPCLVILSLLFGIAQAPSDDPPDPDWRAKTEHRILERLNSTKPGALKCDFVVNSDRDFAPPVPGRTTVLNFWRPGCEPCKPLLDELAAFSKSAPAGVVVMAAAEDGSPSKSRQDVVAVREQISAIVRAHGVDFPVCGYTDHAQTKRWQAEGVPLTLLFDVNGRVGRVALGAVEASAALKQLRDGWRP